MLRLQIRYFNSLFYCIVSDLFNQHRIYVSNSFHRRSQGGVRGFIFYCFSTYCYLEVRKQQLFLSPSSYQMEIPAAQVGSQWTLVTWCLQRGEGRLAQSLSSTWVEWPCWTGEQIYCLFKVQHPECWILPIGWIQDKMWSSGREGFPKDTLGKERVQPVLMRAGAGAESWHLVYRALKWCSYLKLSKRAQRVVCFPVSGTSDQMAAQRSGHSPLLLPWLWLKSQLQH